MKSAGAAVVWLLGTALLAQAPIVRRAPMQPLNPDPDQQQAATATQEKVPTIRVQSRLVNIAVSVMDKNGAPVGGLSKEDFAIAEDGKPQKITYFDRESSTPLSIVLAIDASKSVLRDERLEKTAATHFVNALLREQDELDLMDFSDTVREIVPFTNEKKRIERGLNELQPGDETALYDAIFLASDRLLQTRNDAGRRRVVVVITDGEDTAKHSRYSEALEQAQRAGAIIYPIIIVPVWQDAGRNTGGEHALIQMAMDTGGKYFYVEDKKDLEPAFARVSDDLRTQYVLGYYAPPSRRDDSFRSVKVQIKDPALQTQYHLRHRSGYYPDGH
ncbi:MAG TPA: VWA domain-containing protein [Edaphobacter sp.]|nr:VWA domain-containing protein [Edaphobacter sp.]